MRIIRLIGIKTIFRAFVNETRRGKNNKKRKKEKKNATKQKLTRSEHGEVKKKKKKKKECNNLTGKYLKEHWH